MVNGTTSTATIQNCYNSGEITIVKNTTGNADCGGIVGMNYYGTLTIDNCHNTNNVTGGNIVGGIIADTESNSSTINTYFTKIINSSNTGVINGSDILGGMIGSLYFMRANIINCYNTGNINATRDGSGICRSAGSQFNIINCYNTGKLSGTYQAAILYSAGSDTSVNVANSYYKNDAANGMLGVTNTATAMADADMKASSFVTTLNNNKNSINLSTYGLSGYGLRPWALDAGNSNNGYPIFSYASEEAAESAGENYSITTGTTTRTYSTLATAIASATNGQTIKVLQDVVDTSTVSLDKYIYLETQNHTITRDKVITIASGGALNVRGEGTITNGTTDTISNAGTLKMTTPAKLENTKDSSTNKAVANTGSGKVIMTYGTIEGVYKGIYNMDTNGTLDISGGTVTANTEKTESKGIINYSSSSTYNPTTNITGTATVEGYNGLYNYGEYATTNIGSTSESINIETPLISGTRYGFVNDSSGKTFFYNGLLQGGLNAHKGAITGKREHYSVVYENNENNEQAYLSRIGANNLKYTGLPQELVTIPNDINGTVYFSTTTELTEGNYNTEGTTTIPTGTDVGEYTIHYFVLGNNGESNEMRKCKINHK